MTDGKTSEQVTTFPSYSLEQLRIAPTKRLWRIEISHILNGKRDHILEQLGDAGSYVEEVIRNSDYPEVSKIDFSDALDDEVSRWSPGQGDRPMIELLHRFTPPWGYARLIEALQAKSWFFEDPDVNTSEPIGATLRLLALHALERYFPAPPLTGSQEVLHHPMPSQEAYQKYLDILHHHSEYLGYREYATDTLKRIESEVRDHVSPENTKQPAETLASSYKRTLKEGTIEMFLQNLKKSGVGFKVDREAITINGKRENAPKDTETYAKHFELYIRANHLEKAIASRIGATPANISQDAINI